MKVNTLLKYSGPMSKIRKKKADWHKLCTFQGICSTHISSFPVKKEEIINAFWADSLYFEERFVRNKYSKFWNKKIKLYFSNLCLKILSMLNNISGNMDFSA